MTSATSPARGPPQQHRLKARGTGSHDWDDFPATLYNSPYLGGMICPAAA
jgi:hypothetical protein